MSFTKAFCDQCRSEQGVDDATGRFLDHEIPLLALRRMIECASSGAKCPPSKLPGWHSLHVCGVFCDGQDGGSSRCAWEKQHPPSIVDRLRDLA